MMAQAWIILAILGQERFSLAPDDASSPVRMVISVPEPLARAGVFLSLELPNGTPVESEIPMLLRQGGWAIERENNLVRLCRTDDSRPETAQIKWRWRPKGSDIWREDQWTNLIGPAPLESRREAPTHTRWRRGWGWVVAEGLATAGLMAGLLRWLGFRHPANQLRLAMKRVGPGEPSWARLQHFVNDYLAEYWKIAGRKPSLDWHMKRLDPDLGRRLEQLTEATRSARHGTVEVDSAPLVEAWGRWLTDAEDYRIRRL